MAGKVKNLTMQVGEELADHFKDVAERRQISIAELMKEGTGTHADYDDEFLKGLKYLAKKLKLPLYLVIQNKMIRLINEHKAHYDVWGVDDDSTWEFMWDQGGPVTGQRLADTIYANAYRIEAEKKAGVLENSLRYGAPLSPHDQEWLDEYKGKHTK
jgi:hypothetical protein